jgi:IMP dehydrogenase
MNIRQGLTFDDVLLVPKHSTLVSRKDVDTTVNLGKEIILTTPIIPANMKSVTEDEMARVITSQGGMALLHRFMSIEEQVEMFQKAKHPLTGASVGVRPDEMQRVAALVGAGCHIICVDVAHGDSEKSIDMVQHIHKEYPAILLIAGNVATAEGALRLWKAGADVIKVGIGPGSLCTTRIETGNGVPQLTALAEVYEVRAKMHATFTIIADGGIKNAGDLVKALCFSDAVMVGNLLAGTDEAPGEIISIDGQKYKQYRGSSTYKTNHIEGVSAMVVYKGPVLPILTKLMEGVRSGCSYQGAKTLVELKRNPEFVLISGAGLVESHPHDVVHPG